MTASGVSFGSVCSGIEAASVAWHPLGWRAAWLAEVAPFPSAVLAHHYPQVPNLGDMKTIARRVLTGEVSAPDVFCGGTPCQAFSVAGLRESLADERGNLTLKFVEIADAIDHVRNRRGEGECIVFWENVPGVLSTKDNAFGCFLGSLAGEDGPLEPPGGKWANAGAVYGPRRAIAWRTLDAQYFGVAQRRRRVFVVASARKGFDPAQVLFEWDGVRRDIAPSREARETAPTIPSRSTAGGGLGTDFDCDGGLIAGTLQAGGKAAGSATQQDAESGLLLPVLAKCITTGTGLRYDTDTDTILPVMAFNPNQEGMGMSAHFAPPLGASRGGGNQNCIAFDTTQITSAANGSNPQPGNPCHPLAAGAKAPAIAFPANLSGTQCASTEELAPAMGAANPTAVAVPVHAIQAGALRTNPLSGPDGIGVQADHAYTLEARAEVQAVQSAMQVRRLTPEECEALQGFQRGYTRIPNWNGWRDMDLGEHPDDLRAQGLKVKQSKTGKWRVNDPDSPRYKALGNSWAVPNVNWLGQRIAAAIGAAQRVEETSEGA